MSLKLDISNLDGTTLQLLARADHFKPVTEDQLLKGSDTPYSIKHKTSHIHQCIWDVLSYSLMHGMQIDQHIKSLFRNPYSSLPALKS